MKPNYHDKVFLNTVDFFMCGFSLREASRLLGIKMPSIQNRIRARSIDHFLVNDRVFITDEAIATYRKGRFKKEIKEEIREAISYKVTLNSTVNPDKEVFFHYYSLAALDFFLDIYKRPVKIEKTKVPVLVSNRKYIPKEILFTDGFQIFVQPSKTGYLVEIRKENDKDIINKEMSCDVFADFKKNVLEGKNFENFF